MIKVPVYFHLLSYFIIIIVMNLYRRIFHGMSLGQPWQTTPYIQVYIYRVTACIKLGLLWPGTIQYMHSIVSTARLTLVLF